MSQYEINEYLLGESLIPPYKRTTNFVALIKDFISNAQWLNDKDNIYLDGDPFLTIYDPTVTYDFGELVIGWFNFSRSIFLSLQDANLGNDLNATYYWLPIIDNFIPAMERALYNSDKMVLEWALNKYFGSNFVQPPGISDIYISDLNLAISPLYISAGSIPCVGGIGSTGSIGFIGTPITTFDSVLLGINYIVNVPITLYSALPGFTTLPTDSTPGNVDHYFTNFINNYNLAGTNYRILCY